MVELGIHSIKKWDVIKEIVRFFPNVLFFVGCPTTEYIAGVVVEDQWYSVFFGKKKNTREEQDYYYHIEILSSITQWILFSVKDFFTL